MSTRARVKMKDYDGESYYYSVGFDGYQEGVVRYLPDCTEYVWRNGEQLFDGTFSEAKPRFR